MALQQMVECGGNRLWWVDSMDPDCGRYRKRYRVWQDASLKRLFGAGTWELVDVCPPEINGDIDTM